MNHEYMYMDRHLKFLMTRKDGLTGLIAFTVKKFGGVGIRS